MALSHLPIAAVDEGQLRRLIDSKAAECRDIEYKSVTYGSNDDARTEFLADISSFANSVGGDLVIGMSEIGGVPTSLGPIAESADPEILRLESMARTGIEPRIVNLQFKAVPLSGGGAALVVRVPRSYNPPHRVIFKGKNRFWARSSAGKYEPNVDELRALFNFAPHISERVKEFRMTRVVKIASEDTPVGLLSNLCVVMHLVPFSAFDLRSTLLLPEAVTHPNFFPPIAANYPSNYYVNFDGFLLLSNAEPPPKRQRAYVQVFRSGILEAVASNILVGAGEQIVTAEIEAAIVKYSRIYMTGLHACGVEPPYALNVSLLGVKGRSIVPGYNTFLIGDEPLVIDREQLHFSGIVLDTVPKDVQEAATLIRPLLDQLANVAGMVAAPTFDAEGTYLLLKT